MNSLDNFTIKYRVILYHCVSYVPIISPIKFNENKKQ